MVRKRENNNLSNYLDNPLLPASEAQAEPWVFTVERQVTLTLLNPDEVSLTLPVFDNKTNQQVTVFNIACNQDLTWSVFLWDCGDGRLDASTTQVFAEDYANATLFDYIVIEGMSSGFIGRGEADPQAILLAVNINKSLVETKGAIRKKLQHLNVSTAGSILDSSGKLELLVCLHFNFTNTERDMPIRITLFENCPPGTSSATGTSVDVCLPCDYGYVQPNSKSTSCIPCENGFYQDERGKIACKECAPGFYSTLQSGAFSCEACVPGQYLNNATGACDACGKGYYTDQFNSSVCLPCEPSKYQDGLGQDHCIECGEGRYSNSSARETCDFCPETHPRGPMGSNSVDNCESAPGYFTDLDGTPVRCETLGTQKVECIDEGLLLEELVLRPGFWRTGGTSKQILSCLNAKFCKGGNGMNASTNGTVSTRQRRRELQSSYLIPLDYCIANHLGVLCEQCQPGYVRRGLSICEFCDAETIANDRIRLSWTIIAAAILVLLAFFVVQRARLVSFYKSAEHRASMYLVQPIKRRVTMMGKVDDETRNKRINQLQQLKNGEDRISSFSSVRQSGLRKIDEKMTLLWHAIVSIDSSTTIRILVSLFQVIGGMSKTFYDQFPTIFHSFAAALNILSAEIFYNIDFACIVKSNHYLSLVLGLVSPLVATLVLLAAHFVIERRLRNGKRLEDVPKLRNGTFSLFLLILFLIYPGVSNTILSTFVCKSFDDGSSYLRKDLTVSCIAPERWIWLVVASVGAVVYVGGIPAVYFFTLWRVRKLVNPKDADPNPQLFSHVVFLTEIYRKECWWYEVFELFRKLCQTTLILFIFDGSVFQNVVMIGFSTFLVNFIAELKPYNSVGANKLAIVAQWEILICSLLGLLYKIKLSNEDRDFRYDANSMLDTSLILALISTPVFALYQKRQTVFRLFVGNVSRIKTIILRRFGAGKNEKRTAVSMRTDDAQN